MPDAQFRLILLFLLRSAMISMFDLSRYINIASARTPPRLGTSVCSHTAPQPGCYSVFHRETAKGYGNDAFCSGPATFCSH